MKMLNLALTLSAGLGLAFIAGTAEAAPHHRRVADRNGDGIVTAREGRAHRQAIAHHRERTAHRRAIAHRHAPKKVIVKQGPLGTKKVIIKSPYGQTRIVRKPPHAYRGYYGFRAADLNRDGNVSRRERRIARAYGRY